VVCNQKGRFEQQNFTVRPAENFGGSWVSDWTQNRNEACEEFDVSGCSQRKNIKTPQLISAPEEFSMAFTSST
jgi:hypothetical protein